MQTEAPLSQADLGAAAGSRCAWSEASPSLEQRLRELERSPSSPTRPAGATDRATSSSSSTSVDAPLAIDDARLHDDLMAVAAPDLPHPLGSS